MLDFYSNFAKALDIEIPLFAYEKIENILHNKVNVIKELESGFYPVVEVINYNIQDGILPLKKVYVQKCIDDRFLVYVVQNSTDKEYSKIFNNIFETLDYLEKEIYMQINQALNNIKSYAIGKFHENSDRVVNVYEHLRFKKILSLNNNDYLETKDPLSSMRRYFVDDYEFLKFEIEVLKIMLISGEQKINIYYDIRDKKPLILLDRIKLEMNKQEVAHQLLRYYGVKEVSSLYKR